MMNLGKGYLTYTMAVLAIAGGVASLVMGWADQNTALTMVWGGLSVFGLRRAIK